MCQIYIPRRCCLRWRPLPFALCPPAPLRFGSCMDLYLVVCLRSRRCDYPSPHILCPPASTNSFSPQVLLFLRSFAAASSLALLCSRNLRAQSTLWVSHKSHVVAFRMHPSESPCTLAIAIGSITGSCPRTRLSKCLHPVRNTYVTRCFVSFTLRSCLILLIAATTANRQIL